MKVFSLVCENCGKRFESVASRTKYCDVCRNNPHRADVHELWHGKWIYTGKDYETFKI